MIPIRSGRGDKRITAYQVPVAPAGGTPPTGPETARGLRVKAAFLKRRRRKRPKSRGQK